MLFHSNQNLIHCQSVLFALISSLISLQNPNVFWTKIPQGRLLLNKFSVLKKHQNLYYSVKVSSTLCNFLCSCVLSSQRFFRDYTVERASHRKQIFRSYLFPWNIFFCFLWERLTHTDVQCALIKSSPCCRRGEEQVSSTGCVGASWPKHRLRGENFPLAGFCLFSKRKKNWITST